ncbi:MAG: T9SS type A sorting domain-containing protein [Chitinophagaceae bacterium]|nr:T9SS type A sorting domain-containing protein [Chitinophagaceae bacterium]
MVNISLTSFFVFLCFQLRFLNCSAQIALESVYDSAGYTVQSSLAIVNLEEDGEKFVRIVRTATERKIDLYNMDHSWWKTIECISFPVDSNSAEPMVNNYFMYISQHLFNLDDEIEFLYFSAFYTYCRIYDESGNIVFNFDGQAPIVAVTIPPQQFPIYNTGTGTKMIMSSTSTHKSYVYSLPGTLPVYMSQSGSVDELRLSTFPNPSFATTNIAYELPVTVRKGEISIRTMSGTLLNKFIVDNTFGSIVLSNEQLSSGVYLVTLQAGNAIVWERQLIVK